MDEIINKLNNTITKYGKIKFQELGQIFISDINVLQTRKRIITTYMENKQYMNTLINKLELINKYENDIYDYFSNNNLPDEFIKIGLFINIKHFLKMISHYIVILVILFLCDSKINYKCMCGLIIFVFVIMYNNTSMYTNNTKVLIDNINNICELCKIILDINENDIATKINLDTDLLFDFAINCSKNDNDYIGNCSVGEACILKINKKKYENVMNEALEYIGMIDAYICISKIIIDNGLTIPVYEIHTKPYIYIENMINPLIYNYISNDIYLGDKPVTVLIGESKSGITTIIETLFMTLHLAQTYCISYSDKLIMTPFKILNSDNIRLDGDFIFNGLDNIFDNVNLNTNNNLTLIGICQTRSLDSGIYNALLKNIPHNYLKLNNNYKLKYMI